MRSIRRTLRWPFVLAAVAGPATASAQVSMSDLWPNDNGLRWEYEQTLALPLDGPEPVPTTVALRFDGTTPVPGGSEVQNLVQELPAASPAPGGASDPLLRNLWRARPDLRPKLESLGFGYSPAQDEAWESLFIHGGAWEKAEDEIRTWRPDVPLTRSWVFLVEDISVSGSFQLQLIPDIAANVSLTGTVTAVEDVTVPAGTFSGAYRVDYEVDYGEATCTSEDSPESTGTLRSYTRGHVHYVPGVGPVQSLEELTHTDVTGTCPGVTPDVVRVRVTMELLQVPVPVVPVTWGRLKAIY